ncbi:uncharacterized protein M421DRAFT_118754 [Didymella exigua CBS 183.55]|uniref:Uncharacterized protein n=1 Tax=Didymella exigua CBS 183.55 TaxID=1150837 RepID=A0A6A5S3K8_9PLEO|nr:uncharacterized protein M421DRAFT_118754 [Didymella exigua CBS 183.55]KAF1934349.1 hypothetical protein M421DRAFT_118754 [Didymella exigua CBS 183.55]
MGGTVWFCSECEHGPLGDWSPICVNCGHKWREYCLYTDTTRYGETGGRSSKGNQGSAPGVTDDEIVDEGSYVRGYCFQDEGLANIDHAADMVRCQEEDYSHRTPWHSLRSGSIQKCMQVDTDTESDDHGRSVVSGASSVALNSWASSVVLNSWASSVALTSWASGCTAVEMEGAPIELQSVFEKDSRLAQLYCLALEAESIGRVRLQRNVEGLLKSMERELKAEKHGAGTEG